MSKQVIITREYREKIARFAAIKPEETYRYTPKAFRDLNENMWPVFILSPVSGEKILKFSDEMRGDVSVSEGGTSVKVRRGAFTVNVVKAGLQGWENFYDIEGNIVEYKQSGIGCMKRNLIEELAEAILSFSTISEEEVLGLE